MQLPAMLDMIPRQIIFVFDATESKKASFAVSAMSNRLFKLHVPAIFDAI